MARRRHHVREDELRLLLPIALAPDEETTRVIVAPVPPVPGEYEVTLTPAAAPELVLARQRVRVHARPPS